jgi:hypothetical protein
MLLITPLLMLLLLLLLGKFARISQKQPRSVLT